MANKNNQIITNNQYEFDMSHHDIVNMMNDPQVLIEGGNVSEDQIFQIILKKSNGTEILLKTMAQTDTLIFRFKKSNVNGTNISYGIDVTSG